MAITTPISNADLWNGIRAKFPTFKSITSAATNDMFTSNGYEELKSLNPTALNEFFNLSLRVYLQQVNISHAKDLFDGVFETYYMPLGSVIQRLTINPLKPVNPAFHGLDTGDTVDPFIVRKPDTEERFWHNPISFQNMVSIQDFQMKQIFISEFGMDEFLSGILAQLQESWKLWRYQNKLNAINAGINSEEFPLKSTQSVGLDITDPENMTDAELKATILTIKKILKNMTNVSQTNAFNAKGFKSYQDKSRLKLLVRNGFKDQLAVETRLGAFNPDELALGIDVIEVENFGGLEPYKESNFTTPLYPVYDEKLGIMLGWNETQGQTNVTVQDGDQYYKDPNENVIAILVDKGWLFETIQNDVRSDSIFNPRGLYTNTFFSVPNYYTSIDNIHNIVVFSKTSD